MGSVSIMLGQMREVDPTMKPDDRWDQDHEIELLYQRTKNLQDQLKTINRRLARIEDRLGL